MDIKIDSRRITIFLLFTFGIAWLTGLVIYLTGGLVNSPKIVSQLTLGVLLLATTYMWAPAVAHLLVRLITHEGWTGMWLRPNIRRGWPTGWRPAAPIADDRGRGSHLLPPVPAIL